MTNSWLATIAANYNWLGALVTLAGVIALTKIAKYLVFKVPALAEMKRVNREQDKQKLAKPKYLPMIRKSQQVGLYTQVAFYVLIVPFTVTLQAQPAWKMLLDMFVILMFYDFFYYLAHRFWFHGNGPMRQVHAVHHQARNPTYIDAHYVHPLETFIGLALFLVSVAVLAPMIGKFHVITLVVTSVVYTQLNIINHTFVKLPYFPFKTLSWITAKHHVHHENMHKGNYATITLLYDKLFGTLD